ncbi:MAG: transferase [Desulfovibrio sp.]|uniref:transferase n=1 Tax=Desulfovibrio sp. 7SRBS1 TaxID=3378064 RepID=UPI003B3E32EF
MKTLSKLLDHIAERVNVNLRYPGFDARRYIEGQIPLDSHALYYAFYALTTQHPLYFKFKYSSLAGTYFLGRAEVDHSILYKSDIRGDELKRKGDIVDIHGHKVRLFDNERIAIRHSFLVKTLVHNNSHDPENVEVFKIHNTLSMQYANIHGTSVEGCFIGPFATADLSTFRSCSIGAYAYVQAGELMDRRVDPGCVWIRMPGTFEFTYRHDPETLAKYITAGPDNRPQGLFMDFVESRKEDFESVYTAVHPVISCAVPDEAYANPYAVYKGENAVGENVLVAQRAYIENSSLGDCSNAQENCYIINSTYEGLNVTAHGGKVIDADLGRKTFVGFNSFVHGTPEARIKIGRNCIVMPHTIIDAKEPIQIPDNQLIWGHIETMEDLELNSIALEELAHSKSLSLGNMQFQGSGAKFVEGFQHRIEHILEANGAYYDGSPETAGHAQKTRQVSFNLMQSYHDSDMRGMCPDMTIAPIDPE